MKENSIEKEIELLQDETNSLGLFFKCKGMEEYKIALEHILSDYKRVLKENEELLEVKVSASAHNRILELEKENEELKKYKEYYSSARQLVDNNYIQKQKVKEVIKELEDNIYRIKKQYSNGGENCNTVYLENLAQVKILKQILKEVE